MIPNLREITCIKYAALKPFFYSEKIIGLEGRRFFFSSSWVFKDKK